MQNETNLPEDSIFLLENFTPFRNKADTLHQHKMNVFSVPMLIHPFPTVPCRGGEVRKWLLLSTCSLLSGTPHPYKQTLSFLCCCEIRKYYLLLGTDKCKKENWGFFSPITSIFLPNVRNLRRSFTSWSSAPINHVWTQNPGGIMFVCLVLLTSLYSGKGEYTLRKF